MFADYLLFVSFFPTITSGPIQRSTDFLPEVRKRKSLSFEQFQGAAFTFLWGATLKMIIADRINIFTNAVFSSFSSIGGGINLVGALLYSLQIYADFSGYSYMAIAVAELFGYHLKENFRQPYFATSISDFWKRWHISLTSYFTDYLYIPLGGNRKGKIRQYLNIMIAFLVSGLWHGAGAAFIVWGALHGIYQVVGRLTKPMRERAAARLGFSRETASYRVWQRICVFLLTSFAWIFFRKAYLKSAILFVWQMFTIRNPWVFFDGTLLNFGLTFIDWTILYISFTVWTAVSILRERGHSVQDFVRQNPPVKVVVFTLAVTALAVFGIYGEGYSAASFIYAGF